MILYILHVALLITVCVCFYMLFLRKETFYKLNRFALITILVLSFIVPLISVPPQWALGRQQQPAVNNLLLPANNSTPVTKPEPETVPQQNFQPKEDKNNETLSANSSNKISWDSVATLVLYLYWTGVFVFALNFLLQLTVLLYRAWRKPVIKDGQFKIVELTGDKVPCSFGNYIFINPSKYDWETYNQILLHEKTHISQKHTYDIILVELLIIVQWFNPFAWLYRKVLENNLEFLTDSSLLKTNEIKKDSYQLSLLKVSVPQFSLGLTTNYNQSTLQKRIIMMNAKKSNLNTMWKYFFLLPLIGVLMCALNNTIVHAQPNKQNKNTNASRSNRNFSNRDHSSGSWFATIKNDKVRIQFMDNDSESWNSNSDFPLSEFSALPKNGEGTFTLKREAGTINFKGKFDGDKGYGDYKFTPDENYLAYLKSEGITGMDDNDAFAFFTIDIKKDYIKMLHENGYAGISKNDLIPMAALKIDAAYIQMWKQNGFKNLSSNELVSAKALEIDNAYVADIKKAGYNNLTLNQLISFKAQHITGDYINSLRKAKVGDDKDNLPDAEQVTAYKAMDIDENFIKSFEAIGYINISYNDLTSMKATNITPAFVKGFTAIGYKDISVNELLSLKSLDVTPEFIKGLQAMGFNDMSVNEIISVKATGITPEYIKSFQSIGFTSNNLNDYIPLKSLNITPGFIEGFKKLGFTKISINDLPALKSTGVTPEFVKSMQDKGIKLSSLDKYIQLKTVMN